MRPQSWLGLVVVLACGDPKPQDDPSKAPTVAIADEVPTKGDGPFGLTMGMSEQELKRVTDGWTVPAGLAGEGIFQVTSVPSPHRSFEAYGLVLASMGLCKITAVGKTIATAAHGTQLREEMESLRDALSEKYGKPTQSFDFLSSGSIWNDPQDFMMGLVQQERNFMFAWEQSDSNKLPSNLKTVLLQAKGIARTEGYVSLVYEFTNATACLAELAKKKNNSL